MTRRQAWFRGIGNLWSRASRRDEPSQTASTSHTGRATPQRSAAAGNPDEQMDVVAATVQDAQQLLPDGWHVVSYREQPAPGLPGLVGVRQVVASAARHSPASGTRTSWPAPAPGPATADNVAAAGPVEGKTQTDVRERVPTHDPDRSRDRERRRDGEPPGSGRADPTPEQRREAREGVSAIAAAVSDDLTPGRHREEVAVPDRARPAQDTAPRAARPRDRLPADVAAGSGSDGGGPVTAPLWDRDQLAAESAALRELLTKQHRPAPERGDTGGRTVPQQRPGATLAQLRLRNGTSLTDVASQLHLTEEQVAAVEVGAVDPPASTLFAIAEALGARWTLDADVEVTR